MKAIGVARRARSLRPQDGWGTPRGLFATLDEEFGFTLDVCATPNLAKCDRFFTPEQNGLTQVWVNDVCWMNPPYSNIAPWTAKAAATGWGGGLVVGLLPVRTDLAWFQRDVLRSPGAEIRFIRGRISFEGTNSNAPFPSMIVVWGSSDNESGASEHKGEDV